MIDRDMNSKYQNGQIYKITDIGYNKCYIGSTCEKLSQRMTRHRGKYTSYLNGKCTKTCSFDLFDEYGVDNCKIERIEHFPCNSKEELRQREGFHIKNTDCVNKYIPQRSSKQYYNDNYDFCREQRKLYGQLHKEEIKEYNQRRWQEKKHIFLERKLCECGRYYQQSHRSRHIKSEIHKRIMEKKKDTEHETVEQSN